MEPALRDHPAHAIVVLGVGVRPDGSLPFIARARVERAVELYRRQVAPRIIFTGKYGLIVHEPPALTEAEAMARYAQAMGVPREAMLIEDHSRDTLGNAYFTKRLFLQPNGWTVIRVITSDFHLSRSAWIFRKMLGAEYDCSFVSAPSGFSPAALIGQALHECKLMIFMAEWLSTVDEADDAALTRLMNHEHFGYAEAPTLTREEMTRRLEEIARIRQVAGNEWSVTVAEV